MDKMQGIMELLGEDNTQRLKNSITDLLIDIVKEDLENMCDYLIDFNDLFENIRKEVYANVKSKMIEKYTHEIETNFENMMKTVVCIKE